MAKIVLKDVTVVVDGVALADHCSAVATEDTAEELDATGFGSDGYKDFEQGLKDATLAITLFQDFAAASVHATLEPIYRNGTAVVVVLKPTSAAVSATNPSATMTGKLFAYSGLSGEVGQMSTIEATFRNSGNGIVWATA